MLLVPSLEATSGRLGGGLGMFGCISGRSGGGKGIENLKIERFKIEKLGSFRANLVAFRVSKCSFSGWDTVSQISRLQLYHVIINLYSGIC